MKSHEPDHGGYFSTIEDKSSFTVDHQGSPLTASRTGDKWRVEYRGRVGEHRHLDYALAVVMGGRPGLQIGLLIKLLRYG